MKLIIYQRNTLYHSDECEDNSTMIEHVCGKDPQNVMYVDAVSKQDLVPWYEMMVSWLSV